MIRLKNLLRNTNYLFATQKLKKYQKLLREAQYYKILDSQPNMTQQAVKKKYYSLLNSYHPDKNMLVSENIRSQHQQICKIIIQAYEKLSFINEPVKKTVNTSYTYKRTYQPVTQQQILYHSIFGKLFEEDPYFYFAEKNEHLRKLYQQKLQQLKQKKGQKPKSTTTQTKSQPKPEKQTVQKPVQKQKQSNKTLIAISITGIISIIYMSYKYLKGNKKQQSTSKQQFLTQQKIQQIKQNHKETSKLKIQKVIEEFKNQRPPSLLYPRGDPNVITQILKYTIVPDIQFFQVSSSVFHNPENNQNKQQLTRYPISYIKPNSVLTLGLQAERCLHNIYVHKNSVLKQIQQKGFYQPPVILFRFFGYICFKIRNKPLNLQNFKNTEWVSLFDLFFQFYSPIFFKKDQWNQYRVYYSETADDTNTQINISFIGNSHLNHRPIPVTYLKGNQKGVYMWKPKSTNIEASYGSIWGNYYNQDLTFYK